jgi:hypothetical protein
MNFLDEWSCGARKRSFCEVLITSAGLVTAAAGICAAKIDDTAASEEPVAHRLHRENFIESFGLR